MPNRKSIARMRASRCPACQMRRAFCVCDEIPRLALDTRVIIIMHWREARAATNSARLAAAALPNSEIRLRGAIGAAPLDTSDLARPGAVTLFPSESAEPLTPELWAQVRRDSAGAPPLLVVPDGTWSQARRIVRREGLFARLRHVRLPEGLAPSRYVRREPGYGFCSTFEAVARAIGVIESREAQERLEAFFDMATERIRYSRGELTRAECRHPVPEAALREAFEAGCRGGPPRP